MYEIIIGRDDEDKRKFGVEGTVLLAKHYVRMGATASLSNPIYMDVIRPHVVFICGKRGSGKSYTMGALAESISSLPHDISRNLSVIILDTMGIYWTMKYKNERDTELLAEWGLKPGSIKMNIYIPAGFYDRFKESGMPADMPFAIRPGELNPTEWCMTFEIDQNKPIGVLIEQTIHKLRKAKENYSIADIIRLIRSDKKAEQAVRDAAENRFMNAQSWGLFSDKATPIKELVTAGLVSVVDISCYATSEGGSRVKALVIGILAQKLFANRMVARRREEFDELHATMSLGSEDADEKNELPITWVLIDEAHEFLPRQGNTVATQPLLTLLREGRQPGIALVLATQQPGKIHTDVMTQSDIVISHRITAKMDVDALGTLMQSYMRQGLDAAIDELPSLKGAAVIFDDTNERIYPARIRPRVTWHGGASPTAIRKKKEIFDF
ncbi:hypothetical protein AUJ69_03925 [Candidatus Woesearchaeota archaeon CG1_02_47_18]|nr:MAG: hypothetical protein AUJ69_03925 [Candidatus Woesearchaeota archaeon CG1_02_47_18]HII30246.1 ATP-binding protein [Candidatus Woesearchaeota archaeon]